MIKSAILNIVIMSAWFSNNSSSIFSSMNSNTRHGTTAVTNVVILKFVVTYSHVTYDLLIYSDVIGQLNYTPLVYI